jgi:hypothetical protein
LQCGNIVLADLRGSWGCEQAPARGLIVNKYQIWL